MTSCLFLYRPKNNLYLHKLQFNDQVMIKYNFFTFILIILKVSCLQFKSLMSTLRMKEKGYYGYTRQLISIVTVNNAVFLNIYLVYNYRMLNCTTKYEAYVNCYNLAIAFVQTSYICPILFFLVPLFLHTLKVRCQLQKNFLLWVIN